MTPCREWQGPKAHNGYGLRWTSKFTSRRVHRQIMEMVYGPEAIKGKVVMHLCDNPSCFRFDHLRIASQSDNMQDCATKGRTGNQYGNTHCVRGHEWTEANTYINPQGGRYCRACRRVRYHATKGGEHGTD